MFPTATRSPEEEFAMGKPYAHPEALVSADWVQDHLKDPKVRIVESDEDLLLYDVGHVAGGDEASIRVFREEVLAHTKAGKPLIDVRSPKEYTGELLHMEEYPQEGSLRGGHIPGARNVPWARAVNEDGTFKSTEELIALYQDELGLKPTDDIVAYCRIGERSSLTWFVLTYLLGFSHVRNYDGSWTEWGNLVRVPIARGA